MTRPRPCVRHDTARSDLAVFRPRRKRHRVAGGVGLPRRARARADELPGGTDEASAHTGYARYRKKLLQGGVELLEFRPGSTTIREHAQQIGSSAQAGLHAKSFAVDRKTKFVGSFNLDPRSARLNTEMGLLIDSPSMAEALSKFLDGAAPGVAFQVKLDAEGHLQWLDGSAMPLTSEPEVSAMRSLWVRFLSWLPIEWLL